MAIKSVARLDHLSRHPRSEYIGARTKLPRWPLVIATILCAIRQDDIVWYNIWGAHFNCGVDAINVATRRRPEGQ